MSDKLHVYENDGIRVEGTQNLVQCALATRVEVLRMESTHRRRGRRSNPAPVSGGRTRPTPHHTSELPPSTTMTCPVA